MYFRSPTVRYPEERHNWESRSQDGEGEWERKYNNEAPAKWERPNRRHDWERKKGEMSRGFIPCG